MRLFSLCLLAGLALAIGGCDKEKKPDNITTPPPGSTFTTSTKGTGS